MKKLFTLLAIALFGVAMWSCSYDDDDLWKAVDDLDSRMEAMEQAMKSANTDIDALQKLVDALQKNVTVTSVIKIMTDTQLHSPMVKPPRSPTEKMELMLPLSR